VQAGAKVHTWPLVCTELLRYEIAILGAFSLALDISPLLQALACNMFLSMAVHLLESGRGIEYVADHLGHKNIQNTRIYAQITNPLREQVFRELEQHPKIVRIT
jgi:hypothetical protein